MKFTKTKSEPQINTNNQNNNIHHSSTQAQNNQKVSFKFISNDYSHHLNCPICNKLMIRPMRLHPCGHTFCQQCINPMVQINFKVCPIQVCSRKLQLLQNDRTAQSLIDQLKVQCKNDGCVWKGEYDNYKKTHKEACVFKNGSLDDWIANLKKGVKITKRTTLQDQQKKPEQINSISQELYHEQQKKQKTSNILNLHPQEQKNPYQQKQKMGSQIQYEQKENHSINSAHNSFEQKQPISEKKEKRSLVKQQAMISNLLLDSYQPSVQNNMENIQSMRIGRNSINIFNMPFGPSIEHQNSSSSRKSNLLKKQLKKLQGWS